MNEGDTLNELSQILFGHMGASDAEILEEARELKRKYANHQISQNISEFQDKAHELVQLIMDHE